MKKIIIFTIMILAFLAGDCYGMKFRIYDKAKTADVEKYRTELQAHYNATHIPGTPWIISCPVKTWDDKIAVPLATEIYPNKDAPLGVADSIDPPKPPKENEVEEL